MTQTEIDKIILDQIGPDTGASANPLLAEAQANYVAEAARVAEKLNQSLIDIYHGGFVNWADQVTAGKIPNANPPQPPAAYMALKASDGWTYVVRGTDPVCAPLPVPPTPAVTVPVMPEPAHVMNVLAGDTVPVGSIITRPSDGTRWQKMATAGPFGVWQWYQQVAG